MKQDPGWIGDSKRAKRHKKLPVVFSRNEVETVLFHLDGVYWMMAHLLYGAGLRLMECVRLRVKDLDFDRNQIHARDGKGGKDRRTMFPQVLKEPLMTHLERVKQMHLNALNDGHGTVYLPYALEKNIRVPKQSGPGNMFFQRLNFQKIPGQDYSGGII